MSLSSLYYKEILPNFIAFLKKLEYQETESLRLKSSLLSEDTIWEELRKLKASKSSMKFMKRQETPTRQQQLFMRTAILHPYAQWFYKDPDQRELHISSPQMMRKKREKFKTKVKSHKTTQLSTKSKISKSQCLNKISSQCRLILGTSCFLKT